MPFLVFSFTESKKKQCVELKGQEKDKTDFLFSIKLFQMFLAKNIQTERKLNLYYLFEKNPLQKTLNYSLIKKNLVSRLYATSWTC